LEFQRPAFGLFRGQVDRVPWEAFLKGKGVQESWTYFRKEFFKAQEQTVRNWLVVVWTGVLFAG